MNSLTEFSKVLDMFQNGILHKVEAFYRILEFDIDLAMKFKEEFNVLQKHVDEWKEGLRIMDCMRETDNYVK